jgi:hypothetical protein
MKTGNRNQKNLNINFVNIVYAWSIQRASSIKFSWREPVVSRLKDPLLLRECAVIKIYIKLGVLWRGIPPWLPNFFPCKRPDLY